MHQDPPDGPGTVGLGPVVVGGIVGLGPVVVGGTGTVG